VEEAEAVLREALALHPDRVPHMRMLGLLLLTRESWAEAAQWFERLLAIDARLWSDHFSYGTALAQLGKESEATAAFDKAIKADVTRRKARMKVGTFWATTGRYRRAVEVFRDGLKKQPSTPNIKNALAWILATCPDPKVRDGKEASRLAEEANARAGGRDPRVLDTLAAAYAEAGRFDEAAKTIKRAVELAQSTGQYPLAEECKSRLKLYQGNRPYHEHKPQPAPRDD
jgi:tetratricopeptide (TPR) repeat protein